MVFRDLLPRTLSALPRLALLAALAAAVVASFSKPASGYALNGKSWPSGTVTMHLGLGAPVLPLSDGSATWNAAIAPALTMWNQQMGRVQLAAVMDSGSAASSGDRVNSVVFSNSVFGQSFGTGTLAVTYYVTQGSNMIEADVLFNRAQTFDSYRGDLRFGGNGYAVADIRRVFLHEMGHGIGLNHQEGDNIMAALVGDREMLSTDDVAGARAMYGAPAATPTPTPVPTPPPSSGPARLANISTRMRVGVGDQVAIGGFIIQGTQAKKLILRATGPSLGARGVAGAMQDPVLELYDAVGNLMAQNDDWQSGGQAGELTNSGLAPTNPAESALVATLNPGTYTAVLRGRNNTQGVALVEAYEVTAPGTRLANLSTRGRIGANHEVLIGGVIAAGDSSKRVLIRAAGPSLAAFLNGTLANPTLEVYNGAGQLVGSNDNWGSSAQVNEIIASTLAPGHALESAVVATLTPGTYTAIVSGVNNTTGVGLVEVYDLGP